MVTVGLVEWVCNEADLTGQSSDFPAEIKQVESVSTIKCLRIIGMQPRT